MVKKLLNTLLLILFSKLGFSQCIPTGMVNWDNFNITNVTITGDGASNINNSTGADDATYTNFTSQSVDLSYGNTYNISVTNAKETWGHT